MSCNWQQWNNRIKRIASVSWNKQHPNNMRAPANLHIDKPYYTNCRQNSRRWKRRRTTTWNAYMCAYRCVVQTHQRKKGLHMQKTCNLSKPKKHNFRSLYNAKNFSHYQQQIVSSPNYYLIQIEIFHPFFPSSFLFAIPPSYRYIIYDIYSSWKMHFNNDWRYYPHLPYFYNPHSCLLIRDALPGYSFIVHPDVF